MGAPLLQAQIDIDAPPAKVWALISDLSRMPEWSPQTRKMKLLGGMRVGAKTVNVNRRGLQAWPTTSTITAIEPERRLAFRVDLNGTEWSYELEPIDGGTRVIESRRAPNGVKKVSTVLVNAMMGGVPSFEEELVDGMNQTLARIKDAAERG
ncbi:MULTISPECIES: SRPBCC family protein [Mycobacteriaceae]|uniref:Polyketide cyclase n=1 Tax=Mycolicibacterium neoaurum VKM Ac-1815D TaxID=700508 RepID=V5XHW4_MYCNE|nr:MULTISPECIES: SRPBCC family protein [Mycobacteriaceae]AHC27271.1 polyketide cyclase [Mycolicibacterium neoaurum VKM Ac-1815D]AMO07503.1 polyketide cyclase [Mycolicibacterium neoaurum]AXK74107.1 SRPBCC family protein [Mycolicibacterium neoaurum]KJQ51455.1 polyketide cyclase [Mycolicibacterium neoaurum]KUM09220.1 polyketide cyclase [Mycolicibacterium neoaurum]